MEISASSFYSSSVDRITDHVRKSGDNVSRAKSTSSSDRNIVDTVSLSQNARDYLNKMSRQDMLDTNVGYANEGAYFASSGHLSGQNLANANFINSYLRGANLSNSNLRAADFRNADLTGVDFTGADTTGTDFRGANMTNTIITRAQFAKAQVDDVTRHPSYNFTA